MEDATDRSRHRQAYRCLRLVALLVALLPGWAVARSHHHRAHGKPETEKNPSAVAPLPASTELEPPPTGEPGAPDYAALLRELEEGYRKAPGPEQLYRLGQLQSIVGRVVAAQDFMRRYLADPLADPAAPQRADAERVLELARQPSGELQVAADQEGLIAVDGHIVGAQPLAMPLLLPVGAHVVSLEMRDKTMKGKLKVLDGRGAVMRFSPESGAVLVTLPPAVIVLPKYDGLPAESQRKLQQTAEQGIQKARLAVYSREAALLRAPDLKSCLAQSDCQAQLVRKSEVEYALSLAIERRVNATSLRIALVDGETEDLAATAERVCDGCTPEALVPALAELVAKVLKDGPGRPRGTLILTSQPPGAEVREGARLLGKTPFEHVMFVGAHALSLRQPGYAEERLQIAISDGQKTNSAVNLAPVVAKIEVEPPPSPLSPVRFARPRWRLVAGGVLLGVGLVLGGVGVSGLVVNDSCVATPVPPATQCRERFDTLTSGGALLGVGLGLSAAGTILLAVPRFPGEGRGR